LEFKRIGATLLYERLRQGDAARTPSRRVGMKREAQRNAEGELEVVGYAFKNSVKNLNAFKI
jgi:hypothetical protein